MTREQQIQRIHEIAEEVDGTVRTSYSGRCMYGRTCYGIYA